jgi:hypothetical protein
MAPIAIIGSLNELLLSSVGCFGFGLVAGFVLPLSRGMGRSRENEKDAILANASVSVAPVGRFVVFGRGKTFLQQHGRPMMSRGG